MRRGEFITLVLTLGLVLAIGLVAVQAHAQTWPQRTVRVILPLPPGTATDIAARLFAQRLAERWGQPVIVENRQGGDGIPAVMSFLAARDNHTLMFSFAGVITINPLIHDKLPYDPARDLVPVASVVDNFFAIAASAALKVASLEDFIRLVRSQPGKLNWAARAADARVSVNWILRSSRTMFSWCRRGRIITLRPSASAWCSAIPTGRRRKHSASGARKIPRTRQHGKNTFDLIGRIRGPLPPAPTR